METWLWIIIIVIVVLLSIVLLFLAMKVAIKLTTGWDHSYTTLVGKTVIVTGANTGIGFKTALDFAKRGARVILACRNPEAAEKARRSIIEQTDNTNIVFKALDQNSFESVASFASDFIQTEERLDILVNNAGASNLSRKLTQEGLLPIMKVNYFSSALLTLLLLDKLKQSAPSRIVNVSSDVAMFVSVNVNDMNWIPFGTGTISDTILYSRSKLCNALFTLALAEKLRGSRVTSNCLHPGVVKTDFLRNSSRCFRPFYALMASIFMKNAEEGAQTTIYVSVSKEIQEETGCYFADCKKRKMPGTVRKELAEKLWCKTIEVFNRSGYQLDHVKS